jgi:DNA-binding protein Alba
MEEIESNIVYIGSKESSVYVLYALHQFMINGDKEIVLQARGNFIPKAIVIAGILKNNYIPDLIFRVEITSDLLDNNYVPGIKIHASKFSYVII